MTSESWVRVRDSALAAALPRQEELTVLFAPSDIVLFGSVEVDLAEIAHEEPAGRPGRKRKKAAFPEKQPVEEKKERCQDGHGEHGPTVGPDERRAQHLRRRDRAELGRIGKPLQQYHASGLSFRRRRRGARGGPQGRRLLAFRWSGVGPRKMNGSRPSPSALSWPSDLAGHASDQRKQPNPRGPSLANICFVQRDRSGTAASQQQSTGHKFRRIVPNSRRPTANTAWHSGREETGDARSGDGLHARVWFAPSTTLRTWRAVVHMSPSSSASWAGEARDWGTRVFASFWPCSGTPRQAPVLTTALCNTPSPPVAPLSGLLVP